MNWDFSTVQVILFSFHILDNTLPQMAGGHIDKNCIYSLLHHNSCRICYCWVFPYYSLDIS